MAYTDLIGTWQYLGTLTPTFDNWQRFPTAVNSANSLLRLTYYGDYQKIFSKGYLRPVYQTPDLIYGRWLRFYPKDDREMLSSGIPQELLYVSDTITRYFEVIKKPNWNRNYYRIPNLTWSVALEVLDVISLTQEQQAILEQANQITALSEVIKGLLNG